MITPARSWRCAGTFLLLAGVLTGCDLIGLGREPGRSPGPSPIVIPDPTGSASPPGVPAGEVVVVVEGVGWVLITINGAAVPAVPPMTLEFRGGRAVGSGGCNSFGGVYTLTGSALRFGDIASTLIGCFENDIGDREGAYFAELSATRTWAIVEGQLQLSDEHGAVRLVFESGPVRDQ